MPQLTILSGSQTERHDVAAGSNLRDTLLRLGHSPYARATRRLNCGGRGLCATCGVDVTEGAPDPVHWHDKAAYKFRYPRLSCQITIEADMTVRILTDKKVWGKRFPKPGPEAAPH